MVGGIWIRGCESAEHANDVKLVYQRICMRELKDQIIDGVLHGHRSQLILFLLHNLQYYVKYYNFKL